MAEAARRTDGAGWIRGAGEREEVLQCRSYVGETAVCGRDSRGRELVVLVVVVVHVVLVLSEQSVKQGRVLPSLMH